MVFFFAFQCSSFSAPYVCIKSSLLYSIIMSSYHHVMRYATSLSSSTRPTLLYVQIIMSCFTLRPYPLLHVLHYYMYKLLCHALRHVFIFFYTSYIIICTNYYVMLYATSLSSSTCPTLLYVQIIMSCFTPRFYPLLHVLHYYNYVEIIMWYHTWT